MYKMKIYLIKFTLGLRRRYYGKGNPYKNRMETDIKFRNFIDKLLEIWDENVVVNNLNEISEQYISIKEKEEIKGNSIQIKKEISLTHFKFAFTINGDSGLSTTKKEYINEVLTSGQGLENIKGFQKKTFASMTKITL